MGKFNAALLWLGAPLALALTGWLPVWAAAVWVFSPIFALVGALVALGIGAGAIAWIMDACTGDRARRGHGANSPAHSVKAPRTAMMAPSAWTLHHPGSP
jgi:hypothetical protein